MFNRNRSSRTRLSPEWGIRLLGFFTIPLCISNLLHWPLDSDGITRVIMFGLFSAASIYSWIRYIKGKTASGKPDGKASGEQEDDGPSFWDFRY